jgi:DNA-binding NarL/FixJ family response regulator
MSIMDGRIVCLCGRENTLLSLLKWILGEFKEINTIRQVGIIENLQRTLESETFDLLIVDTEMVGGSSFQFVKGLRESRPLLRTILLVPPTAGDEVMEIIRAHLAEGIVIKPFTKEVVSNYVEKLLRLKTASKGASRKE